MEIMWSKIKQGKYLIYFPIFIDADPQEYHMFTHKGESASLLRL